VKYIANSPAKNISSLESHTMVPTLTMFGRFSECTRDVIAVPEVPTALVTRRSMTLCSCRGIARGGIGHNKFSVGA
jgi:hypothetical protein